MKKIIFYLLILIPAAGISQKDLKLWYDAPAKVWTEAVPVGNGSIGGMVFGNVEEELIQLNESSLWSGGPVPSTVNPEAPKYLPLIRQAVFEGDYDKAANLCKKMQGLYSESYLPLGDLVIKHRFNTKSTESYYRDLNISDAIATTRFKIDGVQYSRQVFSSAPDHIFVVRITGDKPGSLSMQLSTKTPMRSAHAVVEKNTLLMKGVAPTHIDPNYLNNKRDPIVYNDSLSGCKGMRFSLI